jgi:hypothetical protein
MNDLARQSETAFAGQPRTNVPVIMCTHVQVVYGGNNITSPSTCAQATFS